MTHSKPQFKRCSLCVCHSDVSCVVIKEMFGAEMPTRLENSLIPSGLCGGMNGEITKMLSDDSTFAATTSTAASAMNITPVNTTASAVNPADTLERTFLKAKRSNVAVSPALIKSQKGSVMIPSDGMVRSIDESLPATNVKRRYPLPAPTSFSSPTFQFDPNTDYSVAPPPTASTATASTTAMLHNHFGVKMPIVNHNKQTHIRRHKSAINDDDGESGGQSVVPNHSIVITPQSLFQAVDTKFVNEHAIASSITAMKSQPSSQSRFRSLYPRHAAVSNARTSMSSTSFRASTAAVTALPSTMAGGTTTNDAKERALSYLAALKQKRAVSMPPMDGSSAVPFTSNVDNDSDDEMLCSNESYYENGL